MNEKNDGASLRSEEAGSGAETGAVPITDVCATCGHGGGERIFTDGRVWWHEYCDRPIAPDAAIACHTEGPWRAVNRPYASPIGKPYDDWCVTDSTGEELLVVNSSDGLDEPTWFPATANAHLIAAAPEMYTALKKIVADIGEGYFGRDPYYAEIADASVKHADAAIAKAEGK